MLKNGLEAASISLARTLDPHAVFTQRTCAEVTTSSVPQHGQTPV